MTRRRRTHENCTQLKRLACQNLLAILLVLLVNLTTLFADLTSKADAPLQPARQLPRQTQTLQVAPVASSSQNSNNLDTSALSYLQRYGYMSSPTNSETNNNLVSEESYSDAIVEFQKFTGLAPTGK